MHALTCLTECHGWGCQCQCHLCFDMPAMSIENAQTSAKIDGSGEERPRSAGTLGARPATEHTEGE